MRNDYPGRNKTDENTNISMPDKYAIITADPYIYAISPVKNGQAYIQPLKSTEKLEIINGEFCINSLPATETDLFPLYSEDLDQFKNITLLRVFYSIVLSKAEECFKERKNLPLVITLELPKLFRFLGKANYSKTEVNSIISGVKTFNNMLGVIDGDYLPILVYLGQDDKNHTITISMPYINRLIENIYKWSVQDEKKKNGKTVKYLKPKPTHSYLIKPSIQTERNYMAVENVHIIVTLIEKAGNNIPHIKAQTLIDRNPLLKASLEKSAPADKNKTLKRAFTKTWELLQTQTYLSEKYPEIILPDFNDQKNIPTMSKLSMVFEFKHKGKRKEKTYDEEYEIDR